MQPDINGVNRMDHVDSKGKRYIEEMCNIAKSNGNGFIEYHKKNFSDGKDELKMSYVEKIPGTELFIGAGVYF